MKIQILKVLAGSRAHGTASENADYDYRGVYVETTKQLVSMGYKSKGVSWVEGEKEDQTSYELENFLNLAMRGHPNILEMLVAPIVEETEDGKRLRELFPYIWSAKNVFDAFNNYGNNRKKHMLNNEVPDEVRIKSGYCYIRILHNLLDILRDKTFNIKMEMPRKCLLQDVKDGMYSYGQIIDMGEDLRNDCLYYLQECEQELDCNIINEFYLEMRKKHWE